MLTITTEKHTLYINIDLLKKRFKIALIALLRVSTYILAVVGIFWIIGTAGASDNNTITFYQIFMQSFKGFIFCVIAYIVNFIKLVIE